MRVFLRIALLFFLAPLAQAQTSFQANSKCLRLHKPTLYTPKSLNSTRFNIMKAGFLEVVFKYRMCKQASKARLFILSQDRRTNIKQSLTKNSKAYKIFLKPGQEFTVVLRQKINGKLRSHKRKVITPSYVSVEDHLRKKQKAAAFPLAVLPIDKSQLIKNTKAKDACIKLSQPEFLMASSTESARFKLSKAGYQETSFAFSTCKPQEKLELLVFTDTGRVNQHRLSQKFRSTNMKRMNMFLKNNSDYFILLRRIDDSNQVTSVFKQIYVPSFETAYLKEKQQPQREIASALPRLKKKKKLGRLIASKKVIHANQSEYEAETKEKAEEEKLKEIYRDVTEEQSKIVTNFLSVEPRYSFSTVTFLNNTTKFGGTLLSQSNQAIKLSWRKIWADKVVTDAFLEPIVIDYRRPSTKTLETDKVTNINIGTTVYVQLLKKFRLFGSFASIQEQFVRTPTETSLVLETIRSLRFAGGAAYDIFKFSKNRYTVSAETEFALKPSSTGEKLITKNNFENIFGVSISGYNAKFSLDFVSSDQNTTTLGQSLSETRVGLQWTWDL